MGSLTINITPDIYQEAEQRNLSYKKKYGKKQGKKYRLNKCDKYNLIMQSSKAAKKVLLLGSGLMTPALVDYLVQFKDTQITVASNILSDAETIAKRHP